MHVLTTTPSLPHRWVPDHRLEACPLFAAVRAMLVSEDEVAEATAIVRVPKTAPMTAEGEGKGGSKGEGEGEGGCKGEGEGEGGCKGEGEGEGGCDGEGEGEGGAVGAFGLDRGIEAHFLPVGDATGLTLRETCAHGEVGSRKLESVF